MRLLVTGGAGFIGSHLIDKLLQEKFFVITIDDFNDYYDPSIKRRNIENAIKNKNFRLFECDIRNNAALEEIFKREKPELIIHLAARAGVRASLNNPVLYTEVNVDGTLNLLDLAKKYNVKKIIFGSSSSVYGNTSHIPFREDDTNIQPISPYGVSKLSAEYYCEIYNKLFGIDIIALRFFTVYGPRQRPDMAIFKFAKCILEGKKIGVFGNSKTQRDYTFVSDIVDGIYTAISKKPKGNFEIYNLGNSHMVELSYLIKLLEKNIGKKAKIKRLPEQTGDVRLTYANISKAKKDLNYNPKVSIEEGISKFTKWLKVNSTC